MRACMERFDVAIIGGGIVGLATALALMSRPRRQGPGRESVIVLEAEGRLAAHQSGHNSGVIHSGLYYKPGSAKARLCVEGRELLERFCDERGVARQRCGKIVVAVAQRELAALDELERRGRANGLLGIQRLRSVEEIHAHEPHAGGIAGLFVPQTGIVDFAAVTRAIAAAVMEAGGVVRTGCRVTGCASDSGRLIHPLVPSSRRRGAGGDLGGRENGAYEEGEIVLQTVRGEIACKLLINCAGLHSDRVARLWAPARGVDPGVRIVPFRGEYHELTAQAAGRGLVRNLIYPVPDPRLPFLGVHFTRVMGAAPARIEAGPNAVLALARHGYRWSSVDARDALDVLSYRGTWALAARHWRSAAGEMRRLLSRRAFIHALQRLVPELEDGDVGSGPPTRTGVRAQAVLPDGSMMDDFWIREHAGAIHVLNAPSPAATASLAIGRRIAALAADRLNR